MSFPSRATLFAEAGPRVTLLQNDFSVTAFGRDRFQAPATGMTAVYSNATGTTDLNNGASTTSGDFITIASYATVPVLPNFKLTGIFNLSTSNESATNSQAEWGFGLTPSTVSAIAEGVYFRQILVGAVPTLLGVLAFNGTETTTVLAQGATMPATAVVHRYGIEISRDQVNFQIDERPISSLIVSNATSMPTQTSGLSALVRVENTGVASLDRHIGLGFIGAYLSGADVNMPWSHALCLGGAGGYQKQPGLFASAPTVTRGAGTTGWPTSNTARAAGTYTATTAPAGASMGGMYLTPAISTLTSDNDYPVFSWQNPAAGQTHPGRNFVCVGARVGEAAVVTIASTNSIIIMFVIGVNSTTSATNVADSSTALAARGIVVGSAGFTATAAPGTFAPGFNVDFSQSPLIISPGNFLEFIIRPFGTVASNTLTISGSVAFFGYYV